jgi:phosphonate transport system ATP-binding protein
MSEERLRTTAGPGIEPAPGRTESVANDAVSARDLWFWYERGRAVLQGVNFAATSGAVTMVLGASGSGKTTLLKLIKGLLRPCRGELHVLGRPVPAGTSRMSIDARVAYIPQQLGLVRSLSVLDNALIGALPRIGTVRSLLHCVPRRELERAHATLAALGIAHKAGERAFFLSGGERQRVAIARALLQQPQLIVADEFLSQLDAVTSAEIMALMRDIIAGGVTLVMSTHDLELVPRYADRVVVLRDGRVVLDRPVTHTTAAELARAIKP